MQRGWIAGVLGAVSLLAAMNVQAVDILPRLKTGDSYGAHPGIKPE